MLLSSHSNLHMVRFFTKEKALNLIVISTCENKRLCVFKWISHTISLQTCHTHLFIIKAESHDWSLYVYYIKIISEIFVTFVVLLCYLSELRMHLWFLLKLGGFFLNFVDLKVICSTQFLSTSFILSRCSVCYVLLILCLLIFEFFSFFSMCYLLHTAILILYLSLLNKCS